MAPPAGMYEVRVKLYALHVPEVIGIAKDEATPPTSLMPRPGLP